MTRPTEHYNLRVSLESHLLETLRPLIGLIPGPLSDELSPLIFDAASSSQPPTPTISYDLLRSISKWARTEEGERELKLKDPPLDSKAYNMVALLAGTRTSPEKKFPLLSQSATRSESMAREINDRRAIVAILNALLSVICTGAAAWWAAQRTGWRDEWKVLLSLLLASIVAISEIGLYIIWESRHQGRPKVQRGSSPTSYSASNTGSDVGEGTSSAKVARSINDPLQMSTSVDPRQLSGSSKALRQRIGVESKLRLE
ncbi:hypothetical protein B0F90DRAFT_1623918 [Multifurca ochricompacta]|uniref:Uncharacterized protein n=1 Tax=Multifurca ochricompacta TaxID=376703 RepID=A0AAD4MA86_9AGAM|nr:hypothetical protein B0F90DRAFT_1623918 [Multifurca ochricompacta]